MRYFNGKSSRAETVMLSISELLALIQHAQTGNLIGEFPIKTIQWPERTRHGARIVNLPDGGQLHADDAHAWDVWAAQHLPQSESWIVRAQQSWRGVAAALALLVGTLAAMYVWALPVAARGITSIVPLSVDAALGANALAQIDGRWMLPSALPPEAQTRIRKKFLLAVQKQYPQGVSGLQLEFRKSTLGPNAFAVPGGLMVLTDELVNAVKDDDVVLGVMGHELGHVTQRHGMRQLVQVGVLQAFLSIAFGDYGTLITAAPLILGSMAYSREAEREADAASIAFMHANQISPLVMVKFFEIMRAEQKIKSKSMPLGISIISSHPADEERMDNFRKAVR